ncbi:hypothetical protein [Bordetella trematum]|uniref:hypothetical protein n=1 Tax=Bordetella trematum TaxID=123899 RepID=UPI003989794E
MGIYRHRIYAYLVAGVIAGVLGFFPDSFFSQAIQPAVGIWVVSTTIMIVWAKAAGSFRDPMKSIFGFPVNAVGLSLVVMGVALIGYGVAVHSVRSGVSGMLLVCFAVDAYLSKRESWLRYESGINGRGAQA